MEINKQEGVLLWTGKEALCVLSGRLLTLLSNYTHQQPFTCPGLPIGNCPVMFQNVTAQANAEASKAETQCLRQGFTSCDNFIHP